MRYGSMEVTVETSDLLVRLQDNLERHQKVYAGAVELWRKELNEVMSVIDTSNLTEFPEELIDMKNSVPISYVKEYEQAIDMFSMSVSDEITIDQTMFSQYCRDEWDWKERIESNKFWKISERRNT